MELSKLGNGFISSYEAFKSVISVIYVTPGSFDLQRCPCETRTTELCLRANLGRFIDQAEDEKEQVIHTLRNLTIVLCISSVEI